MLTTSSMGMDISDAYQGFGVNTTTKESVEVKPSRNTQLPEPFEQVLGEIKATTSLGSSRYYEVVFHDGDRWRSYPGSDTFQDGEQVLNWKYCKTIM